MNKNINKSLCKNTSVFLLIPVFFLFLTMNTFSQEKQDSGDTLKHVSNKENNPVLIPNTQVKFVPPEHFKYLDNINAFIHLGSASTIHISEIEDSPYIMVTAGLTEEHFISQGVELISKEDVKTKNNKDGIMYIVAFTVKEVEFERIMYFTGDYNKTVWVNANYPVLVKNVLFNVLKESILSVEF